MDIAAPLESVLGTGIPVALIGGLVFALVMYAIFTAILWYHWTHYAVTKTVVERAVNVYIVLSVIFIGTAIVSTATYVMTL